MAVTLLPVSNTERHKQDQLPPVHTATYAVHRYMPAGNLSMQQSDWAKHHRLLQHRKSSEGLATIGIRFGNGLVNTH